MARTDLIISVDARDVTIIEKDGSEILFNETTRVSTVGYSVRGNADLTNADCQLSFILNGKNTGFAKFSELTSVLLTGVENRSNYANWREAMDDLEGYFFAQTVTVGNLSGLATAANQSELLLRFGAADGSPAIHTLLYYQLAQATVLSEILEELSTGRTEIANQMTTQGSDSSYLSQDGTAKGSFNWVFTLGAGTNGLGTLYGNNDGTNADFDVAIGNTGSQTADAAGVISWDAPWKYVKFVFTTQNGAGSTFDGTTYAV